jgi:hypothetical protein
MLDREITSSPTAGMEGDWSHSAIGGAAEGKFTGTLAISERDVQLVFVAL